MNGEATGYRDRGTRANELRDLSVAAGVEDFAGPGTPWPAILDRLAVVVPQLVAEYVRAREDGSLIAADLRARLLLVDKALFDMPSDARVFVIYEAVRRAGWRHRNHGTSPDEAVADSIEELRPLGPLHQAVSQSAVHKALLGAGAAAGRC